MISLLFKNLSGSSERIIHSLKTAFACLLGFVCIKSIGFHTDQWLIITILVVMCAQINVGSVVQKSYMRFLGTLAGSVIAAITIVVLGTDPVVIAIVVTTSALLFSYLATAQKKI